MILYADTSALVKKYVEEAGSDLVVAFFNQHPVIGTAALTQVEMAAVLSKAARLGWVKASKIAIVWQDFLAHWPAYTRLPISTAVVQRAASLAWHHGLRAYDSVHLASALAWKELTGEQVIFACFDKNLLNAAQQEGMQVWPKGSGG